MKSIEDVNWARGKLCTALATPGLSETQRILLNGMLNALVWVADGKHSSTVDQLLAGRPIETAAERDQP